MSSSEKKCLKSKTQDETVDAKNLKDSKYCSNKRENEFVQHNVVSGATASETEKEKNYSRDLIDTEYNCKRKKVIKSEEKMSDKGDRSSSKYTFQRSVGEVEETLKHVIVSEVEVNEAEERVSGIMDQRDSEHGWKHSVRKTTEQARFGFKINERVRQKGDGRTDSECCSKESVDEILINVDQRFQYELFYSVKMGVLCKSFDIIPDDLGKDRSNDYPLTMTIMGGTQSDDTWSNNLLVMKFSDLESEERLDNDVPDDRSAQCAVVRHSGCVYKTKVTNLNGTVLAATWSDLKCVFLWDLTRPLQAVNDLNVMATYKKDLESPLPLYSFNYPTDGFALQWSPNIPGLLSSGDSHGNIWLYWPKEGGEWAVDENPYQHFDRVFDIQFSPNQRNIMISCSEDRTIKVWDLRIENKQSDILKCLHAHNGAVTSISWNPIKPYILSGGCDGYIRIWDLRKFSKAPRNEFLFHKGGITTVEWNPVYHSCFTSAATDDRLVLWDIKAKGCVIQTDDCLDESMLEQAKNIQALPKEILYIHRIQPELKEVHWHKQMPEVVISSCAKGFKVIQSNSMKPPDVF